VDRLCKGASGPSAVEQGVESAELDPSIIGGEAPADLDVLEVAFRCPSGRVLTQWPEVRDATVQTLAAEHRQFDLGHVQPRAVLGGVEGISQTPA